MSGAASAQQDDQLAMAGAEAAKTFSSAANGAQSSPVTYFNRGTVEAAFAKDAVLFDGSEKYMVHASRREKPGLAEVHTKDADIIYVPRRDRHVRHRRNRRGRQRRSRAVRPGEDALDGIKVDQQGNLYVSGPGGLWILSAEGKHLGTIIPPKHPHNLAWGDEDGKTLYLCARSGLHRMRLNVAGVRP